ncbi:MAG TPA: hypothetical protein VN132_04105 [Bdellovibrio sp.]|nr:hypothetical protein [Bdellovibrio sp.]
MDELIKDISAHSNKFSKWNLFVGVAEAGLGKKLVAPTAAAIAGYMIGHSRGRKQGHQEAMDAEGSPKSSDEYDSSDSVSVNPPTNSKSDSAEFKSSSVSKNLPGVMCDPKGSKWGEDGLISYSSENDVTAIKYTMKDSPGYIEFVRNDFTNESKFLSCLDKDGKKCETFRQINFKSSVEALLGKNLEEQLKQADAIKAGALNADQTYNKSTPKFSQIDYMKKKNIKYPSATKASKVVDRILSEPIFSRMYDKCINAEKEALKGKYNDETFGFVHEALSKAKLNFLSKEDFRQFAQQVLFSNFGLKGSENKSLAKTSDSSEGSLFTCKYDTIPNFFYEEAEKSAPIIIDSDSKRLLEIFPKYVLSKDDNKSYINEKELKYKEAEEVYQKSLFELEKKLGSIGRRRCGSDFEKTCRIPLSSAQVQLDVDYYKSVLIEERLPNYSELGLKLTDFADCCMDSKCKPLLEKKQKAQLTFKAIH